jgi:hypothetical protein
MVILKNAKKPEDRIAIPLYIGPIPIYQTWHYYDDEIIFLGIVVTIWVVYLKWAVREKKKKKKKKKKKGIVPDLNPKV